MPQASGHATVALILPALFFLQRLFAFFATQAQSRFVFFEYQVASSSQQSPTSQAEGHAAVAPDFSQRLPAFFATHAQPLYFFLKNQPASSSHAPSVGAAVGVAAALDRGSMKSKTRSSM